MSNADVLSNVVEAFNDRDFDRVAGLVTDGCDFVDVAAGETSHGPDEIVASFWMWANAFSDMAIETLNVASTDRGAAGEFVGRGTHDGSLPAPDGEIAPTGKRIEVRFSVLAEVEGERLAGFREYYDAMTLMAQLGLIPEPVES
jgi:predicted ester cyclase